MTATRSNPSARFAAWAVILFGLIGASMAVFAAAPSVFKTGFEDGVCFGWTSMNGCQARYALEKGHAHTGSKCLVVSSNSAVAPNVYGRLAAGAAVSPDTDYELSVWVRGEDVSAGAPSHFTDWQSYTLNLPTGTFDWTRVSTTFRTKPNQYTVTIGMNIVDKCKALAIDDVTLQPIGREFKGAGVSGSILAPVRVIGDNAPGYLVVRTNSSAKSPLTMSAWVGTNATTIFAKKTAVKPGQGEFSWDWNSGNAAVGDYTCKMKIRDAKGSVVAEIEQKIAKVQSPIDAGLKQVDAKRKEFDSLYKQCKAKGIPLDYPATTKTMLDQFVPIAREDAQMGQDWRATFAVKDFDRSLDESIADMKAYLRDAGLAPDAVRYQTSRVKIDGLSLVADRKDSKGVKSRGPVFFCGYGHFQQVRKDMPRWPGYGVNMIQFAEMGPSAVLTGENEVSLDMVKLLQKTLDDAAKNNVKVDFLISPHYFPQWALDKWPELLSGGGGFLGFCPDLPPAKQVVEKFLRTVIPMIKDKPALASFCLSNEPVLNNTASSPNTKPMWGAYLAKIHGDVKTMNERYGTNYAAFEDVPVPANDAYDAPQFYDWCVFNQERFAAWHKWMADICHELAPNVPVHAKMMSMALPYRFTISWGCDPELFGQLSDLNGNDCAISGPPGGGWQVPFHLQNMSYDLQRSLALKPIYNSENHITGDRSTYYVAPSHFRTALWQGAIHGQGMTTIWVWEHTNDPGSDLYGNVMDRPGCAQAVGTACLDLNRFAKQVTALQNAKAPVAIVFSIASITRSAKYLEVVNHVYNALNYDGVKIDFISEKQLAEGKGSHYKMVILPQVTNVVPATFQAIKDLPSATRVVIVGDSLGKDPYGKDYPADDLAAIRARSLTMADADPEKVLWPALREELGKVGGLPGVSVVDASTGEPVWGVEWLPAIVDGSTVINIVDLRQDPKEVKILRAGKPADARDLLSLGGRGIVRTLSPGTPVLAVVH